MTKVDYALMASKRRDAVVDWHPDSGEAVRLDSVVKQILEELSPEELVEYDARKNFVESTEAKAKRTKADLARMALNRDSNSV